MIQFPTDPSRAALALASGGLARAGATDLQERRLLGIAPGDLVDLRDTQGLSAIESITEPGPFEKGLRIGSLCRIQTLGQDPAVVAGYPGLSQAALGLATPQIRNRATLGGNLLQEVRCGYRRTNEVVCLKAGGSRCLAREGDHLHHSVIDLGPCAAPHPSTLAMALLGLDAQVEIQGMPLRSMESLLGDGGDPRKTHDLGPGELLARVWLPAAPAGAVSAYGRTIQRSRSEWPIIEAFVELVVVGEVVEAARLAIGGAANRPLRLRELEKELVGAPVVDLPRRMVRVETLARPLPMTAWKKPFLSQTLIDVAEKALRGGAAHG